MLQDRLLPSDSITTMRFGFVLLIAGMFTACTLPAAAQAPRPINALPPSVSASSPISLASAQGADSEPDTMAPWRYYPLAVGNVWEYDLSGGYVAREAIFSDTLIAGQRYFVRSFQQLRDDIEAPVYRTYLRYDSTSATFRAYLPGSGGGEEVGAFPPCPFDTPPGEAVCDGHSVLVEEDPDGALVFGGDEPGAGPDTVRTAVKSFYTSSGFVRRYAAGVGLAYDGGRGARRR